MAERWATVTISYPGATPERIETQIVDNLENKLREIVEIDIEDLESSDGKIYLMDLSTIDFKRNQYDLIIYKDTGSNFKPLLYDSKITIKK